MSEKPNLYVVLGISSNYVIDCVIIEGYNINDAYYYIMKNYEQFSANNPFIHKSIHDLFDIYKHQYKTEPNLVSFIDLIDNSDELGKNFIKIIECTHKTIINACSYYQNNRKTITLKPTNLNKTTVPLI